MNLNEVITRPQQQSGGFSFADFDVEGAEFVGTAENYPVFRSNCTRSDQVMYAISQDKEEKNFISVMIGTFGKYLNGKTAFYIQRTFTHPNFRNRGLVTALYHALYTKLNLILVSDSEQSPETKSVWGKISKSLPVKILDIRDPQKVKVVDYNQSLVDTEDENIRLVLEKTNIPEELKKLDKYYKYDCNNIVLEDYLVYTHPDNTNFI